MVRVLIADADAAVRSSLRTILDSEPNIQVIAEAASGAGAVSAAAATTPDVALIDAHIPSGDGIDAVRALTAPPFGLPVIVMTALDVDRFVLEALEEGAVGLLFKATDGETIVHAVLTVGAGHAFIAPEALPRVVNFSLELRARRLAR